MFICKNHQHVSLFQIWKYGKQEQKNIVAYLPRIKLWLIPTNEIKKEKASKFRSVIVQKIKTPQKFTKQKKSFNHPQNPPICSNHCVVST
jgi:hypothetical protein